MPRALAILVVLTSCTGVVVLDAPLDSFQSSGASSGAGSWGSHPDCASAAGVRLCGGNKDCAWLMPPECPGKGCTAALDRGTFSPSGAGVCWSDISGAAARQCVACPDGQVCAQRYDDQLVCVPEAVCQALWDIGATQVCRYADKSRYDARVLPKASGCPNAGTGSQWTHFCGGDCPPCKWWLKCTGRSPDHPFGICVHMNMKGEFEGEPCSLDGKGPFVCEQFNDSACGVFGVSEQDASAARRYGICFTRDECLTLQAKLPGGFVCFDKYGARIEP